MSVLPAPPRSKPAAPSSVLKPAGSFNAQVTPPRFAPATPPPFEPLMLIVQAYVFLYVSRSVEFLLPASLRPMLVMGLVLFTVAAISSKIAVVWNSKIYQFLVFFVGWMALSIPFGAWPGGSFPIFMDVGKIMIFVMITSAFGVPLDRWFKIATAVTLASGFVAVLAVFGGSNVADRATALSGGTLSDPNFTALFILTGLPLVWALGKTGSPFTKIFSIVLSLLMFWGIIRTGSRSALVALAGLLLVLLIMLPSRQKIRLAVISCALAVGFGALAPSNVKVRFLTLLSGSGTGEQEDLTRSTAEDSTEGRRQLLMQSIRLTFRHPILGVGPGNFMNSENNLAQAQGLRKGQWHDTHNMYTQVSSEMGIPGLIFFAGALIIAFRRVSAIRKMNVPASNVNLVKAKAWALYMQCALTAIAIDGFFLSVAYSGPYWTALALVIGFEVSVARELAMAAPEASVQPASPLSRFIYSRTEKS
jgi:O-antigen ligase